ncbi:MAG: DUF2306 domain-containing protein [Cyclobacteriaceae bacterium]
MIKLKKSEWFALTSLFLLSFVPSVGGVLRLVTMNSGLEILPANPRIHSDPVPIIFHIIGSVLFCILGAFQFLPSMRLNYAMWHKLAGRIFIVAGVVSALSGLWMTNFYSFSKDLQGNLLFIVRIIVGVAMTTFIVLGLRAVISKQIIQHKAWMIRAYALGQGAGTQVFITIPWILTVGDPTGITRDLLMTAAWIINILVGEWIINRSKHHSPTRVEMVRWNTMRS